MNRIERITNLAEENDWEKIDHQENIMMLSFRKIGIRMNVYYSKMTVATALNHPKVGKTQLYRRNVDFKTLGKLFKNPRHHTNNGYYKS